VSSPIFTRLIKEIGQEQFDAVVARRLRAVEGDLLKQNLGLAPHTYARLKREVSVVLHIAASVDFNADLVRGLSAPSLTLPLPSLSASNTNLLLVVCM